LFSSIMSLLPLPLLCVTETTLLPLCLSITMPPLALPDAPELVTLFWSLLSLPLHLPDAQPIRMPMSPLPAVPLQSLTTLRVEPSSQMPTDRLFAAVAVETVPSSEFSNHTPDSPLVTALKLNNRTPGLFLTVIPAWPL